MLLTFDVDCGELVPGHRFIARGLSDDGVITVGDGSHQAAGFSLEYELVPGVEPDDHFFRYLVAVSYGADAPLPWDPVDGGAVAPFAGGPSTHGSRGAWPLPDGACVLRFELTGTDEGGNPRPAPSGVLTVDLEARHAAWLPSEPAP